MGLEIRTLQIIKDLESVDFRERRGCNLLILQSDGVVLQFNEFKTKKSARSDELTLKVRTFVIASGFCGL